MMIFVPVLYLVQESDKKPVLENLEYKLKQTNHGQTYKPGPLAQSSAFTGLYAMDIDYYIK